MHVSMTILMTHLRDFLGPPRYDSRPHRDLWAHEKPAAGSGSRAENRGCRFVELQIPRGAVLLIEHHVLTHCVFTHVGASELSLDAVMHGGLFRALCGSCVCFSRIWSIIISSSIIMIIRIIVIILVVVVA